jgi:sporulation protein YlmC with PRC-barrel domain
MLRSKFTTFVCATVAAGFFSVASAQVNPVLPPAGPVEREVQKPNTGNLGQIDSVTSGATVRASQMIGMAVHDAKGESVAEINDLVLDPRTGKVRYAAVTYGGFLGLGDKLFAVPFEAFTVQADPDDADEVILVLNINEQMLENAQGFDQDNWPNFGDKSFTDQLDKRYGVDRQSRMNNTEGRPRVNVNINRQ